jgi:hypothetical protein
MSDYLIAHIRVYVPIVVGWVVVVLSDFGLDLDSTEAVAALTGAAIAVYYSLVRALAQRWPQVGILLGVNKAPTYPTG